uniref:Uncharacterized protein n=1 Tax=Arundo donax TaxID=35708 RepID=A0A0A9ALV2_ARUDO
MLPLKSLDGSVDAFTMAKLLLATLLRRLALVVLTLQSLRTCNLLLLSLGELGHVPLAIVLCALVDPVCAGLVRIGRSCKS